MTAAAIAGERERCLDAGMDDFLTKPVSPDELASALTHWLGGDQRRSERSVPRPALAEIEELDGGVDAAADPTLDRNRLDMLRDMVAGDTSYLDRAIGNFVTNAPGSLDAITAAVRASGAADLQHAAHRLAGSALNLGVTGVGNRARELELIADGGTTSGAAGLLPGLADALAQGVTALLAYQAAYRGATVTDTSVG